MITIIGAGPIGSHTAYLLSKKCQEVQILEEHETIGKPVQCTGIVTKSIEELLPIRKEFLINRLKKAAIHAPDGNCVEIKLDELVLDRTRFDSYLAEKARKAGAKIMLKSRATGITRNKGNEIRIKYSQEGRDKTTNTDVLIGADGPNSIVSRFIGNEKQQKSWIGVQAVVDMPVDKNTYSVYFGDDIPGFFGWVVPEDEMTARVGIATTENPRQVFQKFMKRFENCKVLNMQGGLIPKYDPHLNLQNGNAYIVGDAATQVKATTGGGIVPGLKAAECLARSITQKTSYSFESKKIQRELKISLLLRNILDRFNETDYNRLIEIMDKPEMKKILNEESRDAPSRLLFKSILKSPELMLFSKVLFRAKCL